MAKFEVKRVPGSVGGSVILETAESQSERTWYIDSVNGTNATTGYGFGRGSKALSTMVYLVDNATTLGLAAGDNVELAPDHNEGIADDQIVIATDNLHIYAHPEAIGSRRPTFDFDHANAEITLNADDCTLEGFDLRPSITDVLIGLEVTTGATGNVIRDVNVVIGEDGAGDDEFVKSFVLTSGNHDNHIEDCTILTHAAAAGATHGIHIAAASNRLVLKGIVIQGTHSTGGIVEAAAGLNHKVIGNSVTTSGTNYSFHGGSSFAERYGNLDAGVPEDTASNFIGVDDNDNAVATTNVAANDDGSVLERLEAVKDYTKQMFSVAAGTGVYPTGVTDDSMAAMIMSKSATAAASSYNNTTDSLEAISDALGAGTGATAAIVAANLDHLALTADGTDVYPATLATDSILAMAMCKGAAATASTFNNTTDSLEAISDALAAGTGATAALGTAGLDHLFQTADGADVYPASVAEDSALAMILSKSNPAVATSYSNLTDSLEAISDQGQKLDLVTLGTVVAGSLAAIVERCVEKSDGAVLAAADPIFTIAGGPIYVESLVGIVSSAVVGNSNAKFSMTITDPAATIDLSAGAVAINDDAAGTLYTNIGATAVFTPTTNSIGALGLIAGVADQPHWILAPGTLNFTCDAAREGVVKFYLRYKPLSPNSLVTAAA